MKYEMSTNFIRLICFYCLQLVIAQAPPPPGTPPPQSTVGGTDDSQRLLCTPFGACEPCPADAVCLLFQGSQNDHPELTFISYTNRIVNHLAIVDYCIVSTPLIRTTQRNPQILPARLPIQMTNTIRGRCLLGNPAGELSLRSAQISLNLLPVMLFLRQSR